MVWTCGAIERNICKHTLAGHFRVKSRGRLGRQWLNDVEKWIGLSLNDVEEI